MVGPFCWPNTNLSPTIALMVKMIWFFYQIYIILRNYHLIPRTFFSIPPEFYMPKLNRKKQAPVGQSQRLIFCWCLAARGVGLSQVRHLRVRKLEVLHWRTGQPLYD